MGSKYNSKGSNSKKDIENNDENKKGGKKTSGIRARGMDSSRGSVMLG